MLNQAGQKYCAWCEAWQFDHEKKKKQKLGELAPVNKRTDIQLKENKLQKRFNKNLFDFNLNQSVVRCLQTKLFFLSTLLNNESDLAKIKEILNTINICLENIRMAVGLDKNAL